MNTKAWMWFVAAFVLGGAHQVYAGDHREHRGRPDVLFFVVDDLNNWISLLARDAPIQTPNLKRLAERGMLFTRAYCMSAACNPSRAATLTG